MRDSVQEHFKINFDDLSLVDLLANTESREQLKLAEVILKKTGFMRHQKSLLGEDAHVQEALKSIASYANTDHLLNSIEGIRGRIHSPILVNI